MKTKKALTKRFKITKNRKVLRRAIGQDHYRMKKTGEQRRKNKKWVKLSEHEAKIIRRLIKK